MWKVHPKDFLGRDEEHKFSSTQINFNDPVRSHILKMGQRVKDEHLFGDGRDTEPHVTVKYGLHDDTHHKVSEAIAGEKPISMRFGKTTYFPDSGHGDVVKIDIDSPDLHWLNKSISDNVKHTDTHPGYKPHVTVAYVKPGMGKHYDGMSNLDGVTTSHDEILFSNKNHEKIPIKLGDTPIPEKPEAIHLQMQQLKDGKRKVVMVTPGGEHPSDVAGLNTLKHERGTFYYDPKVIGARAIKRAIQFDKLGDILGGAKLGYGVSSKTQLKEPVSSVVAEKNGVDVQAVASDKKHLPQVIKAAKHVGSSVRVEHPMQTIKRRMN